MDEYKYLIYSKYVPMGETCYRLGAEKELYNLLIRKENNNHPFPYFMFVREPSSKAEKDTRFGWMLEVVWVNRRILSDGVFFNGELVDGFEWTIEVCENDNPYEIAKRVYK